MNHYLDIDPLRANVRACRAYTRHYAKSFYFSSHVLPRAKRDAAYAVYAFCRYADNVVDGAPEGATMGELDLLREQLEYVYRYDHRMNPLLLALQHTVHTYDIPKRYFLDLLEGVEMDRTKHRYDSFEELDVYCFRVASVVGLIMTHIFGVSDQEGFVHAAELGTAMQLTNILRDVGEDLKLGRIYLPMDEVLEAGLKEDDLRKGDVTPHMREFLQFQIARARHYYTRAELGVPMLTNDGSRFCVRLMLETYSGILDDIEQNDYNVFTRRAHVPLGRKLRLAVRHALFPARAAQQPVPALHSVALPDAAPPVLRSIPMTRQDNVPFEHL